MASFVGRFILVGSAILGGLLGIAFKPEPTQVSEPLYGAIPYVSWAVLVAGSIGLVLLFLPGIVKRRLGSLIVWIGTKISPEATPAERRRAAEYLAHIDTLLTWVYRRKFWGPRLSDRGKYHEGAPESYGQEIYSAFGIKRKYKRRPHSMAEPDYSGPPEPERHPGAVPLHGTNVRCTGCQWEGPITEFEAHKNPPPRGLNVSDSATAVVMSQSDSGWIPKPPDDET